MQKRAKSQTNNASEKRMKLTIFVEGKTDAAIVKNILLALDPKIYPTIEICNGKFDIANKIKGLKNSQDEKYIALIDADKPSVSDSREEAERQLGSPSIPVFCAVPTIEAWLFADDEIAEKIASSESALKKIGRMSLPESIPYPKYLASQLLGINKYTQNYDFLKDINILKGAARSPSLRAFLTGVYDALDFPSNLPIKSMSSTVSRDVFSTLLRELPGSAVAWKTLSGDTYSAEDLAKNVEEGTDLGKQYVTELLRVARDLILRKAKK
ncbi:DUF4276 family protein [Pseudomonas yamanorum]|uniref:DUF4276 family protein n=1 Tax=Pseudomonas yamanorum TaxID=515393 RepID=UPI0009C08BF7|nr:DUF4276 family protein [Pseudomonas yamanorum]